MPLDGLSIHPVTPPDTQIRLGKQPCSLGYDIMTKLHASMAKAFAAIEGATKDTNNPFFKTKYADLSSVVAAIKPALVANDLFFTQAMHEREGGVCVETLVHHADGGSMSFGTLFVPASKNDAQAYGSAQTYARRY